MNDAPLDRRFLLGGLAGAAGISALAAMAKAGPLNPPAGPIISTPKPLAEIEPRTAINATNTPGTTSIVHRITQPGSYYLTADIVPPANVPYAIYVEADRVTIDLNGFTIRSAAVSNTYSAVTVPGGVSGTVVRNGFVRGFQHGLILAQDATVEDVSITGSSSRGILASNRLVVRRCRVTGVLVGIECDADRALVEDCLIADCTGIGAYLNTSSVLRGVHFAGGAAGAYLGGYGLAESCSFCQSSGTGLDAQSGSTVTGCVFNANATGLKLNGGCRALGCGFDGNTTVAIKVVGNANLVDGCSLSRSPVGVDMTGYNGNLVQRCTLLAVPSPIAVNVGGNWYPNVSLASVNANTNPNASVFG